MAKCQVILRKVENTILGSPTKNRSCGQVGIPLALRFFLAFGYLSPVTLLSVYCGKCEYLQGSQIAWAMVASRVLSFIKRHNVTRKRIARP
jgi:hypothetical protein